MQLKLPIFPTGTKLISDCAGVYEQEGIVQYIVNGLPVYDHGKDDLQAFRFFFSNLINQGLCTKVQVRTEFWVNDAHGLPLMVCTGQLSEKLQHAIEQNIIPLLISSKAITLPSLIDKTTPAICTLAFDREAYEPAFFVRLWVTYRIAVVTYRKNVKDKWNTEDFKNEEVTTGIHQKTMQLCEKETLLDGSPLEGSKIPHGKRTSNRRALHQSRP